MVEIKKRWKQSNNKKRQVQRRYLSPGKTSNSVLSTGNSLIIAIKPTKKEHGRPVLNQFRPPFYLMDKATKICINPLNLLVSGVITRAYFIFSYPNS